MTGVLVLGLGNVLMGDDAFGPSVIEALNSQFDFPAGVSVLDGGTPGLNLLATVIDSRVLLVVDTVKARGEPGDLRFYRKSDLCRASPSPRHSPHDPGLNEVLTALELAGRAPDEALLIGGIAETVSTGTGMSPRLRAAVPKAVTAVVAELERLECPAQPKPQAAPSAPWWEQTRLGHGCEHG